MVSLLMSPSARFSTASRFYGHVDELETASTVGLRYCFRTRSAAMSAALLDPVLEDTIEEIHAGLANVVYSPHRPPNALKDSGKARSSLHAQKSTI